MWPISDMWQILDFLLYALLYRNNEKLEFVQTDKLWDSLIGIKHNWFHCKNLFCHICDRNLIYFKQVFSLHE